MSIPGKRSRPPGGNSFARGEAARSTTRRACPVVPSGRGASAPAVDPARASSRGAGPGCRASRPRSFPGEAGPASAADAPRSSRLPSFFSPPRTHSGRLARARTPESAGLAGQRVGVSWTRPRVRTDADVRTKTAKGRRGKREKEECSLCLVCRLLVARGVGSPPHVPRTPGGPDCPGGGA